LTEKIAVSSINDPDSMGKWRGIFQGRTMILFPVVGFTSYLWFCANHRYGLFLETPVPGLPIKARFGYDEVLQNVAKVIDFS